MERFLALPVYFFYWVVGISSAATLLLSYVNANHRSSFDNIFEFIISDPIAFNIYQHRYAIMVVALLTLVTRHLLTLRAERRKWPPILQELENSRRIVIHLQNSLSGQSYISQESKYQLISDLTKLANSLCNAMAGYTHAPCHVAIKTVTESGLVQTTTRSEAGATTRRDVDDHLKNFPYHGNTAFSSIMRPRVWRKRKGYFLSNHLRWRWLFRCYKNQHKGWRGEYSATLVVPITLARSASDIELENTYGFICVDNKRGNFDSEACRILVSQAASSCIDVIARLSQRSR